MFFISTIFPLTGYLSLPQMFILPFEKYSGVLHIGYAHRMYQARLSVTSWCESWNFDQGKLPRTQHKQNLHFKKVISALIICKFL